jgi:hypothetical protein
LAVLFREYRKGAQEAENRTQHAQSEFAQSNSPKAFERYRLTMTLEWRRLQAQVGKETAISSTSPRS